MNKYGLIIIDPLYDSIELIDNAYVIAKVEYTSRGRNGVYFLGNEGGVIINNIAISTTGKTQILNTIVEDR